MPYAREQIEKLEEFANFAIEHLKTVETIDLRALLEIEAEFEKSKMFVLGSFTPAEIDENPEIIQDISLIEAKLKSALELARAKHKTQIDQKKASILNEFVSLLNKLIEKLKIG
jgi:hypothetical protein